MENDNKYSLKSIERVFDYLDEKGFFDDEHAFRKGEIASKLYDIVIEVNESIEAMIKRVFDEVK